MTGTLVPSLAEQYRHQLGYSAPPSEQRSWERSLDVLTQDLVEAGLEGVEAMVEYQLPLTSKRADVVLCGTNPVTGASQYIVLELKQWSRAHMAEDAPDVCVLDGAGLRLHPVAQVERYCTHLADFLAVLDDSEIGLMGVAYLHNATDLDVDDLWSYPVSRYGRMFTGQRRSAFMDFLRRNIAPGQAAVAGDVLLGSAVRPSRQLLSVAAAEIQAREQFVLLDEQQVAFSMVLRAVERSYRANSKEVIIVSGGPGSGKSVIGLALVGELSRQGRTVLHATGSSAFTQTLRRVAGQRAPRVKGIFRYFNQFVDAERNGLDVLVCDEAHRIRETSASRYTRASLRTGRAQVSELIDAARVPVFLLDEHQVVRPGEIGTIADIQAAAAAAGLSAPHIALDGQFRCGGSRAYEQWVLRLLGLAPGGPVAWEGDANFTVTTTTGPSVMEERLRVMLESGYGARIAAGYCWTWSDPVPGGGLKADVQIQNWHRPWNNKKPTSHAGAPGRHSGRATQRASSRLAACTPPRVSSMTMRA